MLRHGDPPQPWPTNRIISAQAGIGISPLLVQWFADEERIKPGAWLALDEHDNDLNVPACRPFSLNSARPMTLCHSNKPSTLSLMADKKGDAFPC